MERHGYHFQYVAINSYIETFTCLCLPIFMCVHMYTHIEIYERMDQNKTRTYHYYKPHEPKI